MKGALYFSAFLLVVFTSCDSGEPEEELLEEVNVQVQEYFTASINGNEFVVTDPDLMGGIVFTNPDTGVVSLELYGKIDKEPYEILAFTLCFYDGKKTYNTGTTNNNSEADYWRGHDLYVNDYTLEDPGSFTITTATETFVAGEFVFRAYNVDDEQEVIEINGTFGVAVTHTNEWY